MIKMTMIGNLGRDAEVADVNGQKVIRFSVCHTDKYTDRSGQQQERRTWVKCSYWRADGRVGVADYLKTGQKVYVEGMPSVSTYTDKNGQFAASLELRVMNLELVGGNGEAKPQQQQQAQPATSGGGPDEPQGDDLPFNRTRIQPDQKED